MLHDLVFSLRTLLRRPGFALLAVLTVALGIGINSAMFTVVNGVLWKSMPYDHAEQLVMFNEASASGVLNCSGPNMSDWHRRSALLDDIAIAREFPPVTLRQEGSVESITTGYTHPNLFSVLRVQPALGRLLTAQDDTPGAEPAGLITERAWQRSFGSDPAIVGRRVRAHVAFMGKNAESFVVAGVLPAGFRYENIDLWLPLNRFETRVDLMRDNHWFRGIGRLKPGATLDRALAELDGIARDLEKTYPATNKDVRPRGALLVDYYSSRVKTPLLVLFGAVGFVLLIACGNVVHLLLTRTLGRRREIAVRLALGAGQGRLVQLLLAEGLLIAVAGGALGLLFANWGVAWTVATQPRLLPRAQTIHVDGSALLYTGLITVLTFVLLGLLPLWQSSRPNLVAALQSAGRGASGGVLQQRLGWAMVAAELAMACVLLTGAGLMIETLNRLSQVSLGYRPDGVLAVPLNLPNYQLENEEESAALTTRLLAEVRALPGVVSASYAEPFGIGGNGMLPPFTIPGRPSSSTPPMVPATTVSREFFEAMGIPLHAGRLPARESERREALVNEEFVRRYLPGENPVGKLLNIGGPMEIVGVVGNTRLQGPISANVAEVYWGSQSFGSPTLLVRAAGSADSIAPAVRARLKQIAPEVRIGTVQTLNEAESGRTAVQRFTRSLLLIFAALAVALAGLGIYGVVSYAVAQRTHEIGIRMALGASRGSVAAMVLRQTLSAAAFGAAVGAVAAAMLAKFLTSQLYGVTPQDPAVYSAVMVLIAVVAVAATAVPMLRASSVDPAACLRDQ